MKILHVINTAEVGGGGEHLLHLTQGLMAHGLTNAVVVGRPGPAATRLRDAGMTVLALGTMGVGAPRAVRGLLRTLSPDVLHLHGSRSGLVGVLAAQDHRLLPIVYTAHAFSFRRKVAAPLRWVFARLESLTCRRARRVICLTRADLDAARRVGIDTARFVVIPNGIDLSRFPATSNRRAEFSIPKEALVVGLVARLVPQKDPLRFVEMAAAVARAVPAARFLLVGDGPLRRVVEEAVRSRGLDGKLSVTGFRPDVPELLATMDVFVLTSAWEGLPIAVLEAMAAGQAVVVPPLPGIDEVVDDGRTGIIANGRDPTILAAAVEALGHDQRRRRTLGEAARRRIEDQFTVARMADATATVYRDLVR